MNSVFLSEKKIFKKKHNYKVDDLVEVLPIEYNDKYDHIRLYVIGCTRDCDGTPLYSLGTKGMNLYLDEACNFYNPKGIHGFSEECLKLIENDK